jgi:hypothetical protein
MEFKRPSELEREKIYHILARLKHFLICNKSAVQDIFSCHPHSIIMYVWMPLIK